MVTYGNNASGRKRTTSDPSMKQSGSPTTSNKLIKASNCQLLKLEQIGIEEIDYGQL
jgi:hypothetical protein